MSPLKACTKYYPWVNQKSITFSDPKKISTPVFHLSWKATSAADRPCSERRPSRRPCRTQREQPRAKSEDHLTPGASEGEEDGGIGTESNNNVGAGVKDEAQATGSLGIKVPLLPAAKLGYNFRLNSLKTPSAHS